MTDARRACLWVFLCVTVLAPPALAQNAPDAATPSFGPPPAHIAHIEGQTSIDRDGRSEDAIANLPLTDGDRLRTADGRVEVILGDGSLLHLDKFTTADVMANDLVRLLQGRLTLIVRGSGNPAGAVRYQVDMPAASLQTGGPGEFRLAVSGAEGANDIEAAVTRGSATLANELGAQNLRAGERAYVRTGYAPSSPQYFNSARWDGFDQWSAQRRDAYVGTVSGQYLPADLAVYSSTFDRYGTWRNDPTDGYVWYPTVAADWRPYSYGYWRPYDSWGSFWVGYDPWGWPTHHYGRWGFSVSFGWYWMPGTSWGPAWVYWGISSGYVSWCALGRYDYPVYGNWGVHGWYNGGHYDPWRGWNVMRRDHFDQHMPVHHAAVDGHHLGGPGNTFVGQRVSPHGGYAVPRSYAGGTAVPRGSNGGGRSLADAAGRGFAGNQGGPHGGQSQGNAFGRGGSPLQGNPAALLDHAQRRTFSSDAPGAATPRTQAPHSAADTQAFRTRRDAGAPGWGGTTPSAASPEARYRAQTVPDGVRRMLPGTSAPNEYQRSTERPAPNSGAAPRAYGMPDPNSGRSRSYSPPAGFSGAGRSYSAPNPDSGRSRSYGGDSAQPRTYSSDPRTSSPQPRTYSSEPRTYSSEPRRGGSPGYQGGGSSGHSSGSSPRYNSGGGGSQSHGGGSGSSSHRRGGTPEP